MGVFTATAAYFNPQLVSGFVYYAGVAPGMNSVGFQQFFKGLGNGTNTNTTMPSGSYTASVRSINTLASSSAGINGIPSGVMVSLVGACSGSGSKASMYLGLYPNANGAETSGNGCGYSMLVEGPSDLRSSPTQSMPRAIAKKLHIKTPTANQAFNYIGTDGLSKTITLAAATDYYIDVVGVGLWSLTDDANWTNMNYWAEYTGSLTPWTEGTRQWTATKTRGTNAVFNWLKQYTTASMDMQNALISATTYTFTAAAPPAASNFTYGWTGSVTPF